jgi:SNF2 family DNA or RNA helicase
MLYITYKCKVCGKNVTEVSSFKLAGKLIRKLSCNHSQIEDRITESEALSAESIISADKKKLYNFQVEGVKFAERANLNVLFQDEMGLGKTIQILAALKLHAAESLPAAIITKGQIAPQWSIEIGRWLGPTTTRLVVDKSKDNHLIPPRLQFYIFSYDILRRFVPKKRVKNYYGTETSVEDYEVIRDWFTKLGIKSIVFDECQYIKNSESQRGKVARELAANLKYKLAASGTPIKNNSAEFFPILNILAPHVFRTRAGFESEHCDRIWTGYNYKIGGLRDPEYFHQLTKDFIIRRERSEVELDFPEKNRQFRYYDLGDEVQDSYNKLEEQFVEEYQKDGQSNFERATSTLAWLNRMRHLTGLAKVDNVVDLIDEHIESTDRKVAVFTHHIDVADLIQNKMNISLTNLNEMLGKHYSPCYRMYGGTGQDIFDVGQKFQADKDARVLIGPTLAAGEGLNLQEIGDYILVEREWNPPNEEQVEGRFIRIGSTHRMVNGTYVLAIGTVDEKFTKLVEMKRAIIEQTHGKDYNWEESFLLKELAEQIVKARIKKNGG